jgi:hypothetical protein
LSLGSPFPPCDRLLGGEIHQEVLVEAHGNPPIRVIHLEYMTTIEARSRNRDRKQCSLKMTQCEIREGYILTVFRSKRSVGDEMEAKRKSEGQNTSGGAPSQGACHLVSFACLDSVSSKSFVICSSFPK